MTPKDFENEILNYAKQGLRPKQIADILNLVPVSVGQFLNKNGFDYNNKYKINSDYFEKIDTSIKAYFIGLIAADGYIVESKNTIFGIQLNSEDREVIELLVSELETDKPIMEVRNSKMCRFTVGDKKLISDLIKLGIVPNKSLIIGNIIKNISYEFRDAFIAGYLDGDGSFIIPKYSEHTKKYKGIRNRKPTKGYYSNFCVNFRGTKELLQGVIDHLGYEHYNLIFNKTWILNISKSCHTYDFITRYEKSPFKFERKFNKIKHFFRLEEYKLLQAQTISSS